MRIQSESKKSAGLLRFAHNDAFTLAEVLITLVIIGVIAAMTVPTMIAKYQKQVFATAFKKTYTTFAQAIARSQMDNGPLHTWDYPESVTDEGTEEFVKKYLVPYLQISKDCGTSEGQGCFAPHTIYKNLSGEDYSATPFDDVHRYKMVLNDGTSLSVYVETQNCVTNKTRCLIMQVDTNGHRKPNQIGRDLFSFSAYPFTNNVMPDGVYDLSTPEFDSVTKTWKHDTIEAINENCNPSGTNLTGWKCAGKIMLEGWQMNY